MRMLVRLLLVFSCLAAGQAQAGSPNTSLKPMPIAGLYADLGGRIEKPVPKALEIKLQEDGVPPSLYLIGSSTMTGPAGSCLNGTLQDHDITGGVLGMCGLSSRILSKGSRYPCIGARTYGDQMREYLDAEIDTKTYDKRKPFRTDTKGDLLHVHLGTTLKPDLLAFYLGDNEAGYLTDRKLRSQGQKDRYRTRLRSYLHLDTLTAQLPDDQACAIITPTWVSKTTKAYGKTNEELQQLVLALGDEVAGRCHVIYGTELMKKSEVQTFDGMHLGRKSACEFGKRAGLALAGLLGKQAPVLDQSAKSDGPLQSPTDRPLPKLSLTHIE